MAQAAEEMTPERRGWIFLAGDPLRGFGALAVIAQHASLMAIVASGGTLASIGPPDGLLTAYGTVLGSLVRTGYFGLWVFFGLSGYLIGRPFVRAIVKGRPLPSITTFARKRALRILPAYWTILTIVLVFVWLLDRAHASAGPVAELYAFDFAPTNEAAQRIAQGWSLAVEAKFYIGLPLVALLVAQLARRLSDARARAAAIAGPCLSWLLLAPFLIDNQPPLQSLAYFSRLFAAGAALAALEPFLQPVAEGRRRWATVAAVLAAAATIYILVTPVIPYQSGVSLGKDFADLAMGVVVMTLIAAPLVRQWVDGGCWKVLDNPPMRWLGTRSYSFYLIHLLVLYELGDLIAARVDGYEAAFAWLLPMGVAISALAAEVLYRFVERPFLERKREVSEHAERVPVLAKEPA